MKRDSAFAGAVRHGLMAAAQGGTAAWAESAWRVLAPLAAEAAALPATLRDDRFEIYQALMNGAQLRGDAAATKRWGEAWLAEIDATRPGSDDERSALDIARVDAVSILGEPARAIPALEASERAMPGSYNASLRLAQLANQAERYDEALAACDRGLAHATGPLARSWLLQTRAEAWRGKGDTRQALRALQEALASARAIASAGARERNVAKISRAIEEASEGGTQRAP
jgi:tetratricopeptide (TPR) repeat protein